MHFELLPFCLLFLVLGGLYGGIAILIGFEWAIQYVTAVNGLLIILLVFVPGVRKFYAEM